MEKKIEMISSCSESVDFVWLVPIRPIQQGFSFLFHKTNRELNVGTCEHTNIKEIIGS